MTRLTLKNLTAPQRRACILRRNGAGNVLCLCSRTWRRRRLGRYYRSTARFFNWLTANYGKPGTTL